MARRRTIGDNPLDTVIPPSSTPIVQTKKRVVRIREETKNGERAVLRSAGSEALGNHQKPEDLLVGRVESLEQENQCMRWIVGAVLAPLALLALLL